VINRDDITVEAPPAEKEDRMVNPHTSPFLHNGWIVGILIFSGLTLVMNCYDQVHKNT
jgi:hypothetical protein